MAAKLSVAQYAALEDLAYRPAPGNERVKHTMSTPRPNTLVALEILGLICSDSAAASGYQITPAGQDRLNKYLATL
jgi:hypothetical protein